MIDVSEEVPEDDVKELLIEAGVNPNPEGWADGSRIREWGYLRPSQEAQQTSFTIQEEDVRAELGPR